MGYRIAPMAALCLGSCPAVPQQAPVAGPSWSFDFAGEIRERFESATNPGFGIETTRRHDYLLHRVRLSAEARRTDDMRMVVEAVSGFTSGWTGAPPPTQENRLDLLQMYIEPSMSLEGGSLTMRVGRQEMSFGTARLVSVRESANIRRAFDGLRATWISEKRTIDAFLVRPVMPNGGAFDDRSSPAQQFWGLYATWAAAGTAGLEFDAYYLGLERADAGFSAGAARELRHTVGVRVFGAQGGWDWNVESAMQVGSFGESDIRAWTASIDLGYEFAGTPLPLRIGLKADAASGDRDPDDHVLGTFNPLFPKLSYFSEANLATPANLLDLQPNLRLTLSDSLLVHASWNGLWKHEPADAFYAPPLRPVDGTTPSTSREIGWQGSLLVEWQVMEQLEFAATYVQFEPQAVARQAQGNRGQFFGAWLRFAF
jgi:hypothetical protein